MPYCFILLLVTSLLWAEAPVGGYATFDEMYRNTPSVLEKSLYLVPLENEVLKRTKLYNLRFTNARGYDRPWVSETRLFGYTDGVHRYYFNNGVCSPLKGWNQDYAWFYTLVKRTSSGANGLSYLERVMVFEKKRDKSAELTFKKLESLLARTPDLLEEYKGMKRKERDLVYFMNSFISRTREEEGVPDTSDALDDHEEPVYF